MNLHVSIGGSDVTSLALFDGTEIQKSSTDSISTATLVFRQDYDHMGVYGASTSLYGTATYAFMPRAWQEVILTDDSGTRQFAGYIVKIDAQQVEGNITDYVCSCSDYGILLDRTTINETYLNQTDEAIILDAFSGVTGITASAGNIATIVSDLATFEAKDITLRELMERICELTGGEWRVDYSGNLLYYASGSLAASFGLSDQPDGVTTFKHGVTELTRDFTAAANRITILGGLTDGGVEISSTAQSTESISTYGILSATVVDRSIPDQATADLRASAEISQRAFPLVNGRAVTWKDGLDVGQTIAITNRVCGLAQSFIIRSIGIKFIRPGAALILGDGLEYRAEYEIEFGQKIPDLVSALRRLERRTRESTSTPVAIPPPLSVEPGSLASTLTRFYLVNAQPVGAEWDQYEDDATFFLTTDRKIYRRTGPTSWTALVETVDLDGQITETQIEDDSISTPKLQALAVVAGKIAANAVTAGTIAADAVIAGTVAAGAIRAVDAAFDAAAIQNADINSLSASKLTAGTIDASVINVTNLNASNVTVGTLSGTFLGNGTVADIKIASGLSATKLTTGTLDASVVNVTNLNASNITTGTMSATRIGAGTISASVTLTSPTLVITAGTTTVNIDATNKILVTDSVLTRSAEVTASHFRIGHTTDTLRFSELALGLLTITSASGTNRSDLSPTGLLFGLTQVVGAQQAAVSNPTGGATIDTECRTQLSALLSRLRTHGLIAP
jgi:hypothetical protein